MSQALQQPGYDQPGQFPQQQPGTRAGKGKGGKKATAKKAPGRPPNQVAATPQMGGAKIAQRLPGGIEYGRALMNSWPAPTASPESKLRWLRGCASAVNIDSQTPGDFVVGFAAPQPATGR